MKGFSERERDRIEEGLLEAGRDYFGRFGLDRTRIKDLTDAVGIAASTFYQFFDSKELLYLAVLREERNRISAEIEAELEAASNPKAEVRLALEYLFEELETNPLYYRLVVEKEIESLHTHLPDEVLRKHYQEEFAEYEPHAERWTTEEAFRIDDPTVVVGLFRTLAFTITAKEYFETTSSDDLHAATRSVLIDALVDGLFRED